MSEDSAEPDKERKEIEQIFNGLVNKGYNCKRVRPTPCPDFLESEGIVHALVDDLPNFSLSSVPSQAICSTEEGVWHILIRDSDGDLTELVERLPGIVEKEGLGPFFWITYICEVSRMTTGSHQRSVLVLVASPDAWFCELFPFDIAGKEVFYGESGAAWPPLQPIINKIGETPWHQPKPG
jgi:hypothetical protein